MKNINTGGTAFPVADIQSAEPNTSDEMVAMARGMTLRDYFAAKAMQGMMADTNLTGLPEEFASRSYAVADAMLKARST